MAGRDGCRRGSEHQGQHSRHPVLDGQVRHQQRRNHAMAPTDRSMPAVRMTNV